MFGIRILTLLAVAGASIAGTGFGHAAGAGPSGTAVPDRLLGGFQPTSPGWVDATQGPLGDTGSGAGVAFGDIDKDGDFDLYLSNSGANKLLRNEGGGVFVDVTSGPLGDVGGGAGVAFGDIDNDGDLDLYLANGGLTSANKLLRNEGGGVFVDATSGPLGDTGQGTAVAFADIDNDGDLDLYLAMNPGANKLFRNEGGGMFVDATSGPLGDTGQGRGAAFADVDDDGDLDLYLSNSGANKLLRNEGGGTFVNITTGDLGNSGFGGAVAFGDVDNDGDLDLFIATGESWLLLNQGDGTFLNAASLPLAGIAGTGAAFGDVDRDGDLDLYVTAIFAANKLFRNEGDGTFVNATSSPLGDPGNGLGVAFGDVDGDGDLDLYVVNTNSANKLFRNDGEALGNHWLQVNLVGTQSNRAAIGARVRVVTGGLRQVREVSGGAGLWSQDPLLADFGVGAAITVDSIVVRWPSGIVQDTTDVPADQRLTLVESDVDTPTLLALASALANAERVRLAWFGAEIGAQEVTLYRRTPQSAWRSLGPLFADGTGLIVYEDWEVTPGTRYGYRLGVPRGEGEEYFGETWVEVPRAAKLALAGLRPNPVQGSEALVVSFSLPTGEAARLELLDLAGRRVLGREVGSLGAGNHVVSLRPGRELAAGVYLLRLTQGGHSRSARAVVVP